MSQMLTWILGRRISSTSALSRKRALLHYYDDNVSSHASRVVHFRNIRTKSSFDSSFDGRLQRQDNHWLVRLPWTGAHVFILYFQGCIASTYYRLLIHLVVKVWDLPFMTFLRTLYCLSDRHRCPSVVDCLTMQIVQLCRTQIRRIFGTDLLYSNQHPRLSRYSLSLLLQVRLWNFDSPPWLLPFSLPVKMTIFSTTFMEKASLKFGGYQFLLNQAMYIVFKHDSGLVVCDFDSNMTFQYDQSTHDVFEQAKVAYYRIPSTLPDLRFLRFQRASNSLPLPGASWFQYDAPVRQSYSLGKSELGSLPSFQIFSLALRWARRLARTRHFSWATVSVSISQD